MADVCRQIELGRSSSIPEVMVKWEGIKPVFYHRTSALRAYASVCAPEDLLNEAWHDVGSCALLAGGAATVAAILGSPAAALPAFQASFTPCIASKLGERAKQIHVALSTEQKPNEDWHR